MSGTQGQGGHGGPADSVAGVVMETVRRLVAELRTGGSEVAMSLDSALDVDLGLDSLAVAELRTRLEQACGVTLPDQALTRGGTVAGWVELVAEAEADAASAGAAHASRQAAPAARARWRPERASTERARTETPPRRLNTLGEVLDWHCEAHPRRAHLRILDHSGRQPKAQELSYQDLAHRSQRVAAALAGHGVGPGDRVGIMLPTGVDYFTTFLGIGLRGGVPVPLYPPARPAQLEEHLRRQARILDNAGAGALVTVPAARGLARLVRAQASGLRSILTPAELTRADAPDGATSNVAAPDDLALLQYTSGSTGDPKGVMLTHAHLLTNIRALGAAVRATPEDVFVSWLPLYHDMGLIGAWLGALCYGMRLVVMSPMDFLARPARWLWAVHDHRATLSAAPNFGYELCRRIRDDEVEGLDLSSWRLAFNGAEPVSPETIRHFTEWFAPHGFHPEAMTPVYGLAEAALGVTCPLLDAGPRVDAISREALARHGRAEPVAAGATAAGATASGVVSAGPAARSAPAPDDAATLRLVGCGRPLPGYQVRVTDPAGRVLGPRQEGGIEFTGPSATDGYHRSPEHTAKLRHGDWLRTGDLGYVADGELFVTGRAKDIIIRAGRNLHPAELEDVVGEIPGVRKGCVAVFAAADPASAAERLVVLAESRLSDPEGVASLRRTVASAAIDVLGTPPDEVVIAPPGAVLKTSSGKVRRAASRARYESGAVTAPAAPAWWQVARFAWAGALPQARRWARAVSAIGFAAYAWALIALLAPPVWVAVVTLPRASWRWQALRLAGRVARWLTAIPLSVDGADRLAGLGPCVIVANHGSYLDGLALMVSSPRPVTFVAGADFRPVPFVGIFLQRLGCEFVERRQPEPGAPDTRRIARTARAGRPIAIFPEGSMSSAPGLRPFQLGAFAIAVDAGVPVVPAGINGARSVLRPDHGFPRRGAIEVRFGEPVPPAGEDWHAVVTLRDAARAGVLRASGEHDTAR